MLYDKNQIEENGDIGQEEFHGVPRDATPVILEARVNDQLNQRKYGPCQVKEDLADAPPNSRLALVVQICLRYVFEDGDNKFHIGDGIKLDVAFSVVNKQIQGNTR